MSVDSELGDGFEGAIDGSRDSFSFISSIT